MIRCGTTVNDISLDDTARISPSEPPSVDNATKANLSVKYVYDIFQLSVKDVQQVQELLDSGAAGMISTV